MSPAMPGRGSYDELLEDAPKPIATRPSPTDPGLPGRLRAGAGPGDSCLALPATLRAKPAIRAVSQAAPTGRDRIGPGRPHGHRGTAAGGRLARPADQLPRLAGGD